MRTSKAMISTLIVMVGLTRAFAAEFQPIGSVALSMGGAGVASSTGSCAAYYNPALLCQSKHGAEFALAAGVGYREVNLVETADRLADVDIGDTLDELESQAGAAIGRKLQQDLLVIRRELASLPEKNGFQLMPTVSLGIQVGRLGVGAHSPATPPQLGTDRTDFPATAALFPHQLLRRRPRAHEGGRPFPVRFVLAGQLRHGARDRPYPPED